MKTPEEIKKGLECCGMIGCRECPYGPDSDDAGVPLKALK